VFWQTVWSYCCSFQICLSVLYLS